MIRISRANLIEADDARRQGELDLRQANRIRT